MHLWRRQPSEVIPVHCRRAGCGARTGSTSPIAMILSDFGECEKQGTTSGDVVSFPSCQRCAG